MSSPPISRAGSSMRNRRKRGRDDDGDIAMADARNDEHNDNHVMRSSPPVSGGGGGEQFAEAVEADDELLGDEATEMVADGDADLDDLEEEMDEGIDLFREGFENDYAERADDHYEGIDIDDEAQYDAMDPAARRRVEAALARRDRLARRAGAGAGDAFMMSDAMDGADGEGDIDLTAQPRRRRHHYDEEAADEMEANIMEQDLSLDELGDIKAASMSEWVSQPAVQRTIKREFLAFLTEHTDDQGNSVYGNRIRNLGEVNGESLEVSYNDLSLNKAILAFLLANTPTEMLKLFDEVAMEAVLLYYPDYEHIRAEIHVRIYDIPVHYTLRQLRQTHLNCLVRVSGVVTRRTGVFPQLKYIKFDCAKCGVTLGPFQQESSVEVKITYCQNCQSRGPFTLNSEKTVYRNYQRLTLQESPGTVPAGRLPRHREVILLWDLIDKAKPGEEIEVTGIYRNNYDGQLNNRNGFPVFATILEANNIVKAHDQLAGFRLTDQDEHEIRSLAKDPKIIDKIIASIAPSIYGHTDIKTAVALSLFGGVEKIGKGQHKVRGDINVLLLGDPGTAKSQVLKYVEKTAHRAVFATGQGASAVGLTASVRRDPLTSEWTLEGGALVLADRGTCLIDEFDKMNDQDRTSIHEAMEQQTISISKAGIVTTLHARCAIIAAANPIGGRYNSTIPFSANVELTEPILSRFDILCVVRDTVEPAEDERLARFIVGSHARSHPHRMAEVAAARAAARHDTGADEDEDGINNNNNNDDDDSATDNSPIRQDLLRKYILYAREHVRPKLYHMDEDKVARLFADMRRESAVTGAYPITVRHLEAIIRISEAFCRMRLSDYCVTADIDRAIAVTVDSFVASQKVSCKRALARAFAKYTLGAGAPAGKSAASGQKNSGFPDSAASSRSDRVGGGGVRTRQKKEGNSAATAAAA